MATTTSGSCCRARTSSCRGARLSRAIIDRYNVIEPGERVGSDAGAKDARAHATDSGITVLPLAPVRGDTNVYE